MANGSILALSALISLVPVTLLTFRRGLARDLVFWSALAVALAGALVWVFVQFEQGWRTGLAPALWLIIAASLVLFACLAAGTRAGWRLAPLLFPYLLVLGSMATILQGQPERPLVGGAPAAWIQIHILLAVATFALLTLAAAAGGAVLAQERALRSKRPTALSRQLPSVTDSEGLEVGLLIAGEVVLGLGLVTGMATQYFETGALLALDHKSLLSLITFAAIAVLLAAHARTGIRGRRAARYVLVAYVLITLAYPGVKFVTDVILT